MKITLSALVLASSLLAAAAGTPEMLAPIAGLLAGAGLLGSTAALRRWSTGSATAARRAPRD